MSGKATETKPTPTASRVLSTPIFPWAGFVDNLVIPLLAVLLALIIGALVISLAKVQLPATAADFFKADQLGRMWQEAITGVGTAYRGLWDGSFGRSGSISETLVAAIPLILGGLAVALGFKGGLFNIGVEGQLYAGAVVAAWLGYNALFSGLPGLVHLPLALLGGALAGAAWAFIPGLLKARTGAHEVITTIMLNYVAVFLTDYLVNFPMRDAGASSPRTPFISPGAILPRLFSDAQFRLHWGLLLAVLATVVIYWLLFKTTWGFEIRTVGANPFTARYAGMSIGRNSVIAMSLSGLLAGLAGAVQILGLEYTLKGRFFLRHWIR